MLEIGKDRIKGATSKRRRLHQAGDVNEEEEDKE